MTIARILAASLVLLPVLASAAPPEAGREDIYVLRSIREHREAEPGWCSAAKTGFEPFAEDAERFFSFWSVQIEPQDGRITSAMTDQVGELRACFGATGEAPRQSFYAEVKLGSVTFHGKGECLALQINAPEPGLFPVRCQLILSDFAPPYVGGVLTTNTMTSRARFGGASDPVGYTQASIATIRLWKAR